MNRTSLLVASSLLAITYESGAAFAQDNGVEQVVVSASRIAIAGYQAPTPVTVVGIEQLERDAQPDIGDVLRQLPSFGSSASANNQNNSNLVSAGTAGLDLVNLRQLGTTRTLVLFDGQRVVTSSITGGVDLSTIPSALVQRIDVVTGGASAAWGSDAVAGVVNVVINKNFDGLAVNVEGSDTTKDTQRKGKLDASYGFGFDGDRGHVIVSASYLNSTDTIYAGQQSWFKAQKLVNNPQYNGGANGQPRLIHADYVGLSQATQGGLITGNPAFPGLAANALRGIQFVGPNATPAPFNFGNVSGAFSNGGSAEITEGDLEQLTVPLRTFTGFGYASYKITPDIKASIQLNYGKSLSKNNSYPNIKFGNLAVKSDNAYLPASIAALPALQGLAPNTTIFTLGTTNMNNIATTGSSLPGLDFQEQQDSVGIPVNYNSRQLYRGVASLDGSLGDNWSWNAYYQHGESRIRTLAMNNNQLSSFNSAADAVRVTAANVGASGLPIGSIACRSTLTAPTNGCQPLDVFGVGVASPGAIQYVNAAARAGGDTQLTIMNEDVAAGSMQGQLPWGLPAGPVSVAFGMEYRKEGARVAVSPLAQAKVFNVGNFSNFAGQYHVEEGFAEVEVPVLKDDLVQSLNFNAAGRLTSYSTSGLVETWKLGTTSQINDDIRLRATWSFDIRAPTLSELFNPGSVVSAQFPDPHTQQSVPVFTVAGGNPALTPEKSTTISGGVVLTPHWFDGLSLSADWYSISIKGAIGGAGAAQVLQQCAAGVQLYCAQLTFDGTGFPGALGHINTFPLNTNLQTVSGLDFQSDYRTEFLAGALDLHLVGNYTDEETQTNLGTPFDQAGSLGIDSPGRGSPKFKTTVSATYAQDAWTATVQGRIIGSARLNNAWGPLDIDNNHIPMVAYLDLRGSYRVNENVQLYAAIDNVTNVPPPIVPGSQATITDFETSVRDDIYDAIGRSVRVGVRMKF